MPGQVRYRTKKTQSGIFLVRFRTKIWDARMQMPALVSSMPMPSYGDFYNSRRSAANKCLHFANSFVSFMQRQYYWSCNLFSANRRSAANKKKLGKIYYWLCEFAALRLVARGRHLASPLSAGNNVAPITNLYSAITVGAMSFVALRLFFQNSR